MNQDTHTYNAVLRVPPAILIALTIWLLSSLPAVPLPGTPGADKIAHFFAYAALGASCALALSCTALEKRRLALFLFGTLLSALYGAVDEYHQYFVPGRDASLLDWLADLGGSLTGSALMAFAFLRGRSLKKA